MGQYRPAHNTGSGSVRGRRPSEKPATDRSISTLEPGSETNRDFPFSAVPAGTV